MSLNFKVELRPMQIKCPDCVMTFAEWKDLARHWRRASEQAISVGKAF